MFLHLKQKEKQQVFETAIPIIIIIIMIIIIIIIIQGGSNITGTNCDLFTHNQSRSYLNHLVIIIIIIIIIIKLCLLTCWLNSTSASYKASTKTKHNSKQYRYTEEKRAQTNKK
jgi:preprotein translocase subunit SecG